MRADPLQARIEFPDPFYAAAVSPDGSTVLGPTDRVWKNGAIVPLADPLPGRALSASNGGGVIVGAADPSSAFPFRWDHGVVVPLSPHQGTARAVTPDGAIAVGYDFLRGGLMWVGDEAIEIAGFDAVTSISADGETFVEWSDQGARLVSRAGQVDEIPPLLTRADYPHDPIVSGDGSTVVHSDLGEDGINGPRHPFRWRDGGFELLDYGDGVPLPEFGSVAYAVSHNGELIAGCSDYAETSPYGLVERAFVWDAAHGVRALQPLLEQLGASLPEGYELGCVTGVSADGRRIVGRATAPETPPSSPVSFIATLPVACSDDLDNDGDGLTDFGADPDCASRFDVNETE